MREFLSHSDLIYCPVGPLLEAGISERLGIKIRSSEKSEGKILASSVDLIFLL